MDTLYITIENRKMVIHTISKYIITGSITHQLAYLLEVYGYFQIDQSTIVNMDYADYFDPKTMTLYMKNGESCIVSRRNKEKVSAFFRQK